ncbi:MAG TPA: hypothetical protein VMT76_15670 [Puia sp.]|nr:hypothetical protein [Puia sp.]
MRTLICILIATIAFNYLSFASQGKPEKINIHKLLTDSVNNDADHDKSSPKASAKICACQILGVTSNNNRSEQLIAVFAEGTNTGNLSSSFATAYSILQKEKKHLQNFFFDKIKVYEKATGVFSCNSLYNSLKSKYDGLKMYDVLNADILSEVGNNLAVR